MQSIIKSLSLITLLLLAAGQAAITPAAEVVVWEAKVDPWVRQTAASGETEFLLYLQEQADLSSARQLKTKAEKGQVVYQRLSETAARSQAPLIKYLQAAGVEHRSYWIVNLIWVKGDADLVERLAKRADVERIYANPRVQLDIPQTELHTSTAEAGSGVEWNIALVNAPQVWAAGFTGQGVIVGGQDTGYFWRHETLKNQYRGWDGSAADHSYAWHNAIHDDSPDNPCFESEEPCDDDGHGTHTMGTMVGDDGADNQIGMAPGAKWIGCRNMANRFGTPASYIECYQWFVAPTDLNDEYPRTDLAPDVINNSWKCTIAEGCTDPAVLLEAVQNIRAAGILTVHAAGNEGPNCSTIQYPAAIYEESFSVGATGYDPDLTGTVGIAGFSSRGPVIIDGSNRLKPDVTAPGQGIRSAVDGDTEGYSYDSGTSMASPHVAGLAALLISANPNLSGQVDIIEKIIEQSAIRFIPPVDCTNFPFPELPNYTYGWGRIDALKSFQLDHIIDISAYSSHRIFDPGQLITYTLDIQHTSLIPSSQIHGVTVTNTLPTSTQLIGATEPYNVIDEQIVWKISTIGPSETREISFTVETIDNPGWLIANYDYGIKSEETQFIAGMPIYAFNSENSIWLPSVFKEY